MHSITLTELRDRGVRLDAHEAVAIAQQLMHSTGRVDERVAAADGPPTVDNVALTPDGFVVSGCQSTPAVSEIAILLQAMCRDAGPAVPGGLRYAMARALLDVEAPPFDSLEEFSQALNRFERGEREAVVRGVVARANAQAEAADDMSATDRARMASRQLINDRRRPGVTPFDIRRELREVDRWTYEHLTSSGDRGGGRAWLTAGVVILSACAGAGAVELTHGSVVFGAARSSPPILAATPIPTFDAALAFEPIIAPVQAVASRAEREPVPAVVGTAGADAAPAARVELRSKVHARRVRRARASAREESPVVQALKFKWLRNVFAPKR